MISDFITHMVSLNLEFSGFKTFNESLATQGSLMLVFPLEAVNRVAACNLQSSSKIPYICIKVRSTNYGN